MSLEEKRKGFDESSFGTSLSSDPFSSSGLSTPYESELGSTETETESSEGEEFMAELTRQMANYMFQDEDEDEDKDKDEEENIAASKHTHEAACDSPVKWCGSNSTSTYYCDQRLMNTSPIVDTTFREGTHSIEVYELKNQPPIRQESCLSNFGKRQQMIHESAAKQTKLIKQHHNKLGRSGYGGNNLSTPNGSGMRAIFLNGGSSGTGGGGSGSRNRSTSTGTGVFLPRMTAIHNQTDPKKRLGCSTVLVPARVLQALETHFNNMDALSQSNGCGGSTNRNQRGDVTEQKKTFEPQTRQTSNDQAMQLPDDWTY